MSDENDEKQFKVGDRVRLLSGMYEDQVEGDLGTVVAVFSQGDCDVRVDRDSCKWYFLAGEVEKVADEDKSPLPFEVYVGNIRVAAFATLELRGAAIGAIRDNLKVTTKEAGL